MSSNASLTSSSSKIAIPNPAQNYSQLSSFGAELSQKRSNSSGNTGARLQTRQSVQPRNQQALKKQNKSQKRARLFDDDAAEVAAMKSINSRKDPNISHNGTVTDHSRGITGPGGLGSGYHAIDKAKYVHANYRFIVRSDQEYHTQTVDADVHISWDSVLQILASADTQSTSCPICLSVPVAPRMAKCGHIFCFPCLIRFMHSTDDTTPVPERRARWKKCPICEDSVYISEVRPVRWFEGQEASMLREGGDVLLRLLKRFPSTTLALPRDTAESHGQHQDIPWFHVAEVMDYARFMKAGDQYMVDQYDREILALIEQEREDELMFGDETTWTRKAVTSIQDAKLKLAGLPNPSPLTQAPLSELQEVAVLESWDQEQTMNQPDTASIMNGMSRLSFSSNQSRGPKPRAPFYFYHALPNFFLSPLDIRILKSAFGDFAAFPGTLLPRVEHISTGHIVDDDLRKRAKYMAHLPYGAEVSFLECDWTDIISPAVLDQFDEEINRRRKRNTDKEAREERDRIRAEKLEDDQRWAATRRTKRSSISEENFSEADFAPLHGIAASPPSDGNLAQTPPWHNHRSHSSFATLASPGTSPEVRTVWGTAAITPATPPIPEAGPPQLVGDGWLQDWEKDLLDEADAVALVAASEAGQGSSKQPLVSAGKKSKKKKITLMSTNARRGA